MLRGGEHESRGRGGDCAFIHIGGIWMQKELFFLLIFIEG